MTYLLSVSVVLALLFGVYRFALRSDRQFVRNRVYLLAGLAASFVAPLVRVAPAAATVPVVGGAIHLEPLVLGASQGLAPAISLLSWLYLAGVALSGGLLLWRLWQVWAVIQRYVPERFAGVWRIRTRALPTSSFGPFFFWNPDENLSETEARRLVCHELAHIRQGHTWDVLLVELVACVLWFHPVVYLWRRALRDQHEFLADAAATRAATRADERPAYIKQLVTAYLEANDLPLAHGFRSRQLHRRLAMLKRPTSRGWTHLKLLLAVPVLLTAWRSAPTPQLLLPQVDAHAFAAEVAEQPAIPAGGWDAFYSAFQRALMRQPAVASYGRAAQFQVVFTVTPTGEIGWVAIRNTPNEAIGRAASDVLHGMDARWAPGQLRGVPITQKFTLPVRLHP